MMDCVTSKGALSYRFLSSFHSRLNKIALEGIHRYAFLVFFWHYQWVYTSTHKVFSAEKIPKDEYSRNPFLEIENFMKLLVTEYQLAN
jgi:hypothetical protein